MIKYIKTYTIMLSCLIIAVLVTSCDDWFTTPVKDDLKSATKLIQNSSGGLLNLENYEIQMIPGTLPPAQNNVDPVSTLSIEIGVEAPAPLPSGFTLKSQYVRFGPEGFVFNFPAKIYLPAGDAADPSRLGIMRFDNLTNKWLLVPISLQSANPNRLGASVIQLGTFALVEMPLTSVMKINTILDTKGEGGIRGGNFGDNFYWYTLTVKSVILKYPEQAGWYGSLVGMSASSGSDPTGSTPRNPLHMRLPQGQYEIWVSRMTWNQVEGGKWATYTKPAVVNINGPLVLKLWSEDQDIAYEGWYTLALSGGDWTKGRPEDLPEMDVTVGTGAFQATLTWINTQASTTDLDLHLYGPNGLHIYWLNDKPAGSAFELDYDWTSPLGNAVENIYSVLTTYPKGDYRVTVDHFTGDTPKGFNARVVRFGKSKTYSGSISSGQEIEIDKFTIE
ncbi:MAG: hypothetical protein WCR42_00375 [bacterium]